MLDGADAPMNQFDVHPAAAVLPMMADDELASMAEDILANGLIHPIVLDAEGVLVDGRNRLRACGMAGVEPTFRRLNGEDTAAFIVSANLNRRNLSKGQKAMGWALIYPETEKGGRGKTVQKPDSFGKQRLSDARSVVRHSMALAEAVMAGRISLDAALAQVQRELEATVSAEAQLSALRKLAPDLAEMVEDERLTLSEATAALKKRQEDAALAEDSVRKTLLRVSEGASGIVALANEQFVEKLLKRLDDDEFSEQWLSRVRLDPERIGEVKSGADAFTKLLKHMARRR